MIEKVLIKSVAPWVTTAYGIQCGLLARELRTLGYQVAIAATAGSGGAMRKWEGIPVYPSGQQAYGADTLPCELADFDADLLLLLLDSFMIDPRIIAAITDSPRDGGRPACKVAYWCPVDSFNSSSAGLPFMYRTMLQMAPKAVPIAMSRWAEAMFRADGFEPLYVPHMIDTGVFAPMDRDLVRDQLEVPRDAFVITMNGANADSMRKNFPGQFDAFSRVMDGNWLLLLHTRARTPNGLDLERLARHYGIYDRIRWCDQYAYDSGRISAADMAAWYNLGDVHTQCSLAEGFGIPLIEAQACGLPVITTAGSAMTELCGAGWTVPGEPLFFPMVYAEVTMPHRAKIAAAYKRAAANPATLAAMRDKARQFALQYSVETVMGTWWGPALKQLAG